MHELAAAQRFEEAAEARDRAAALASALERQRTLEALRRAGRVELEVAADSRAERRVLLVGGRLAAAGGEGGQLAYGADPGPPAPLPRHLADEVACVASWLDSEAGRTRLLDCEGELSSPLPRLSCFQPRRARR